MAAASTGGFATNAREPRRPDSSPSKAAKISVLAGLCALKYFARANRAAVPDALSSAPLTTWPFRTPMWS